MKMARRSPMHLPVAGPNFKAKPDPIADAITGMDMAEAIKAKEARDAEVMDKGGKFLDRAFKVKE